MTNNTCPVDKAPLPEPPLFQGGHIHIQVHHVGWLVCGILSIVSTFTSFWLINKHLLYYTDKGCQRYIVRLLFMVPIYSLVTLASYIFYTNASPFILIRDGYEGFVVSSFFYLMLQYLSADPREQKQVFRRKMKFDDTWKWMLPLGWVKAKPEDGLHFLQMMKWGVLQYCVVRPLSTLIAVILEAVGLYCEISWSPRWGHIYIATFVSISVTIAMYCLLQLYISIAKELAPYRVVLKLFAVKAVVFLTFWQSVLLSALSTFGVIKDQQYMTATEIDVGIEAVILSVEMVFFAFFHLKAFSYKPYQPSDWNNLPRRLHNLAHAFNFMETWREIRDGTVYIWLRCRGLEPEPDSRQYHFESVMGRERPVFSGDAKTPEFDEEDESDRHMGDADLGALRLDPRMSVPEFGLHGAPSITRDHLADWLLVHGGSRPAHALSPRVSQPRVPLSLHSDSPEPKLDHTFPDLDDPPPSPTVRFPAQIPGQRSLPWDTASVVHAPPRGPYD